MSAQEEAIYVHGGVTLPISGTDSPLKLADPAMFYALDFFVWSIETAVAEKLVEVANGCGVTMSRAIEYAAPMLLVDYLKESQIKFPAFSIYRKQEVHEYRTTAIRWTKATIGIDYIFPPLLMGQSEQLLPFQNAIKVAIDRACTLGYHPQYTPPGGTLGEFVWKLAGLSDFVVKKTDFADYANGAGLLFPAMSLELEVDERQVASPAGTYEQFAAVDLTVAVKDEQLDTSIDVVEADTSKP